MTQRHEQIIYLLIEFNNIIYVYMTVRSLCKTLAFKKKLGVQRRNFTDYIDI